MSFNRDLTIYDIPFRIVEICNSLFFKAEVPERAEEKKLAMWGSEVPDDLVLDQKKLAEALQKVNFCNSILSYKIPIIFCELYFWCDMIYQMVLYMI